MCFHESTHGLGTVFRHLLVFLYQNATCTAKGEEYVATARPPQLMVGMETADLSPRATVDYTRQREACKRQIDELIRHDEHDTVQRVIEYTVPTGRRRYPRASLVFVVQRGRGDDQPVQVARATARQTLCVAWCIAAPEYPSVPFHLLLRPIDMSIHVIHPTRGLGCSIPHMQKATTVTTVRIYPHLYTNNRRARTSKMF